MRFSRNPVSCAEERHPLSISTSPSAWAIVDVGSPCWGEFEQVTRLALQCRADGVECGEADGAGVSCFENRQVGERDSDSLGQLGQRHATLMEHVVQFDDDRHWSHRPFEFLAHVCALLEHARQDESRGTASHRVNEKPHLKLRSIGNRRLGAIGTRGTSQEALTHSRATANSRSLLDNHHRIRQLTDLRHSNRHRVAGG